MNFLKSSSLISQSCTLLGDAISYTRNGKYYLVFINKVLSKFIIELDF